MGMILASNDHVLIAKEFCVILGLKPLVQWDLFVSASTNTYTGCSFCYVKSE